MRGEEVDTAPAQVLAAAQAGARKLCSCQQGYKGRWQPPVGGRPPAVAPAAELQRGAFPRCALAESKQERMQASKQAGRHSRCKELVPPHEGAGLQARRTAGRSGRGPQAQAEPVSNRHQLPPQLLHVCWQAGAGMGKGDSRGVGDDEPGIAQLCSGSALQTEACKGRGQGQGAGSALDVLTAARTGSMALCGPWFGSLNPSTTLLPGWMREGSLSTPQLPHCKTPAGGGRKCRVGWMRTAIDGRAREGGAGWTRQAVPQRQGGAEAAEASLGSSLTPACTACPPEPQGSTAHLHWNKAHFHFLCRRNSFRVTHIWPPVVPPGQSGKLVDLGGVQAPAHAPLVQRAGGWRRQAGAGVTGAGGQMRAARVTRPDPQAAAVRQDDQEEARCV